MVFRIKSKIFLLFALKQKIFEPLSLSRELHRAAGCQDPQVFHVLSPDECPRSPPAGAAVLLLFSTSADHFRRSF